MKHCLWRPFAQNNYFYFIQRASLFYLSSPTRPGTAFERTCIFLISNRAPQDVTVSDTTGDERSPSKKRMNRGTGTTSAVGAGNVDKNNDEEVVGGVVKKDGGEGGGGVKKVGSEGGGGVKKEKLGPWRPQKRLTREKMEQMRDLRDLQPDEWSLGKLARTFGVSSSAVKRILRSKYEPTPEVEERQEKKAEEQKFKRREKLLTKKHTSSHNTHNKNSSSDSR